MSTYSIKPTPAAKKRTTFPTKGIRARLEARYAGSSYDTEPAR